MGRWVKNAEEERNLTYERPVRCCSDSGEKLKNEVRSRLSYSRI